MFSFEEVIDMAVQIEKNGENVYLAAIDHTDDTRIKQLLEWMAKEERHHAKWFEQLKQQTGISYDNKSLQEMSDALVRDYIGGQTFSLQEVDFSRVLDQDELIRIFIEFEKDTILFYDLLVAFVPDEAIKEKIRAIIAEEEKHIQKLGEFISPDE